LHDTAHVVIIGAGIAGASIAYHLALHGWSDVVVLDQGELVGGTTSHAPGLVGQLRSSVNLTRLLIESVSLYRTLDCDGIPGYDEVGSLRLASSRERLQELKRQADCALGIGLTAHLLSPSEAADLCPLIDTAGVEGALYIPSDGSARAAVLAQALITRAKAHGVHFLPHTQVLDVEVADGRVRAVTTTAGHITTEIVVIAAGIWSPRVGQMAGVTLPLVPMQHQYVCTTPIADLVAQTIPNVRDPDNLVYLRQDGHRLIIGGYERNPKPYYSPHSQGPSDSTLLPFDEHRFEPLWRAAVDRLPAIRSATVERRVNGLESFTPDGEFLLGPAAEVKGVWSACGFCAHGVSGAGGVGKVLAEWIVDGKPSLDLWAMDARRFGGYSHSRRYVLHRACEVYSTYYDIAYPNRERVSARGLRLSPVYHKLKALGAIFEEKSGWERPGWFTRNESQVTIEHRPRGFAAKGWSSAIATEHQAARERVALFDETSFSKLMIFGTDAIPFLQRLTANDVDKPVGTITYTQLLNDQGGIECDLTVTRLALDRFLLITGTAFGTHDSSWIRQHLPTNGGVHIEDVTSSWCCFGLFGPLAREVLQQVSDDDLSNAAFPYLTAQRITVGEVPVLALRVTYVGELGWELYAPMEYGCALWQTLWHAGRAFGITPAGYRAIDSLRLEKGYRYWSADINSEYTPYEAGLAFAVRLEKGEFIGRDALLHQKEHGVQRKLCCLTLDDPTAIVLGSEPIIVDDTVVGRVTSGGYGYTVKRSIAYGYLPIEHAVPGTAVDVLWFGERIPARVMREPLYDPTNSCVKR
jgi:glycine cleavage system T protein